MHNALSFSVIDVLWWCRW